MNSLQMILKYWLKSKKFFVYSLFYEILGTIFTVLIPIVIGVMVASLDPNSSNPISSTTLWVYFFAVIILTILRFFANRAGRLKGSLVASAAVYHLRKDIHNAIYRQSFSYFDKTETGQLIARATSDVEMTQMIFDMGINLGLNGMLQLAGITISAFFVSLELSSIFVILIPLSLIGSIIIAKKMRPIYLETRESFGELTNTIRENIVGAQVVRIFNNQDKERGKFLKTNKKFYNASVATVKLNSIFMPLNFILIGLMMIMTLYLGGVMIIQGRISLQTLLTFQGFIGVLMFPLVMLGQIFMMYVQADAALTRVRDVLDSTPDVKDLPDAFTVKSIKGEVEFENVSFGYTTEHRVLKNISFKIPAGKKLAILGTTGSGKSTIINLLPRFYEINEGFIKIDGIDIRKFFLKDLRKHIGLVSQETFLFHKSIAENIAYGKEDATMEEIIEVARIAKLHDFIESLPKGYDTYVGERGTNLSGGQKQRLSIARALIIKPKILILDDSTSSVDVETEYNIQQALENIMKGTTTLIITQRISAIRDADLILVLDKGRVVGFGPHEDLIKSNVLYRQIFETLYQKQKVGIDSGKKEIEEVN